MEHKGHDQSVDDFDVSPTRFDNSDVLVVDSHELGVVAAGVTEESPSTARTLYRAYKQNTSDAEEASLIYLTVGIHHPVISCFREITKADIHNLFSTHKLRKSYNNLEAAILYLGMIDYVAVCVDNPLYNENGKLSGKNVPKIITKILDEFKGTLRKWGLNSQEAMGKRLDVIFSFLRRLVTCFKVIKYDIQFSQLINSLENEIRGKKLSRSGQIACVSGIEPDSHAVLLELQLSNILHDVVADASRPMNEEQKKLTKTKPKSPTSSVRSIPATTTNNKSAAVGKLEECKSKCKPSDPPEKQSDPTVGIKRASAGIHNSQPASKVQKVTESKVAPNTNQGPPKNAFEILMNRSRQLAQQRRTDVTNNRK